MGTSIHWNRSHSVGLLESTWPLNAISSPRRSDRQDFLPRSQTPGVRPGARSPPFLGLSLLWEVPFVSHSLIFTGTIYGSEQYIVCFQAERGPGLSARPYGIRFSSSVHALPRAQPSSPGYREPVTGVLYGESISAIAQGPLCRVTGSLGQMGGDLIQAKEQLEAMFIETRGNSAKGYMRE